MSDMLMAPKIHNQNILNRALEHSRQQNIVLPTFTELAFPQRISIEIQDQLRGISPNEPHPLNLFRIHWYNSHEHNGSLDHPLHLEVPSSISGVKTRIIVALGDAFPMIAAHKVLAAYGCLVTRLVTGQFDPRNNKAIWPSTGNYCRGGVAISRILGCRGVAVLPEQMSQERFNWLEQWTLEPEQNIVRTTGSESNVKEIYDVCDELEKEKTNIILNQFNEFSNYLCHRNITGPSLEQLFTNIAGKNQRLRAFITGTGSSGTIAAGDHLKNTFGTKIVATEPFECPTMLNNGYGEHNIQGIGDKHIPLIHNVMNMDYVIGISDSGPELMNILFNTEEGHQYLIDRTGASSELLKSFKHVGISGLANIQSAIKLAKYAKMDENDVILCVATDSAQMYASEVEHSKSRFFNYKLGSAEVAEIFGRTLSGCEPAHVMELSYPERERIFNLGYYTWVEQRGIAIDDFNRRKHQEFWNDISDQKTKWDELIQQFNKQVSSR
ncbi:pyridoxal-5'-phosphate-dependent protein subunit beta [Candidatus Endobugula sertula]|uniref:cysteine synthase n=1 Tax=Candidatus Endobugula sertula TaxID=62101 RepID=A0A1D2QP83_9GAMM|nr:pyridoxal-5'-phosphate-dependent protein subunit beta [Candidatus Endobugula sertula]